MTHTMQTNTGSVQVLEPRPGYFWTHVGQNLRDSWEEDRGFKLGFLYPVSAAFGSIIGVTIGSSDHASHVLGVMAGFAAATLFPLMDFLVDCEIGHAWKYRHSKTMGPRCL